MTYPGHEGRTTVVSELEEHGTFLPLLCFHSLERLTSHQSPVTCHLSPPHGASSGCEWRRQPPHMEDSCE